MLDDFNMDGETLPGGFLVSDRYEIKRLIGGGGMGSVYLAEDRLLNGNVVALKVLHKEFARDEMLTKRFLREVQLMHLVNHPNVVRTFDVGADKNIIFFTMEFIQGTPLDGFKPGGIVEYKVLGNLIIQICRGLSAIHAEDIVHRDLKPGNILISDDDAVKIADFGVARPSSSSMTQHREIIGSLDYMAPEVWQGLPLTASVDFYSLGIILFELVSGELPFLSDDPPALMWMHCNAEPPLLSEYDPNVPAWLEDLVYDLLQKVPEARPASTDEIIRRVTAKSRSEKKNDSAFPSFSAKENEQKSGLPNGNAEHSKDGVLGRLAEASEVKIGEETGESPAKRPTSMRRATSGIIFRELPTENEIREHEKRVRERLPRKGTAGNSSGRHRSISELELILDEDKSVDAIRRLERILFWVMGIAILSLSGVAYVIFSGTEWDIFSSSDSAKRREAARREHGSEEGDVYVFDGTMSNPFADFVSLSSFFSSDKTEPPPIVLEDPAPPKPVPPPAVASNPLRGSGRGFFTLDFSSGSTEAEAAPQESSEEESDAWWSFDNVMKSLFGDYSKREQAASIQPTIVRNERTAPSRTAPRTAPGTGTARASTPPRNSKPKPPETSEVRTPSSTRPAPAAAIEPSAPAEEEPSKIESPRTLDLGIYTARFSVAAEAVQGKRIFKPEDLCELSEIESSEKVFELANQKFTARERLFGITAKMNSLDYNEAGRRNAIQELNGRSRELTMVLQQLKSQLSTERKGYIQWAEMARLLQSDDVISVANELGEISADIARRKNDYDKSSLKYRDAVEESAGSANKLGQDLQMHRAELRQATSTLIQWSLAQHLTNLLNLTLLEDSLNNESSRIGEELRILAAPIEGDSESIRQELLEEREVYEAELLDLSEELPDTLEEKLRRVWALGSMGR